jgi:hypothetical protein
MVAKETDAREPASALRSIASLDKRLQLAGVLGLCACTAIPLFFFNPDSTALFPPCPFLALTGYYCPGCGTLRGLHQLLHGNVEAALALNALMVLSVPFLAYAFISLVLEVFRGRPLPRLFRSPYSTWAIFVLVVAFWVLRNIPVYPFTLLAP